MIAEDRAPNSSSFVVGLEKAYKSVLNDDGGSRQKPRISVVGKGSKIRIWTFSKRFNKSVLGGWIMALAVASAFVAAVVWPKLSVPRSEWTFVSETPAAPEQTPSPTSDLSKPGSSAVEFKPGELTEVPPTATYVAEPPKVLVLVQPPVSERVQVSLPSGTWIKRPGGKEGHGVLKVKNGTDQDAAVKLVTVATPRKVLWIVYIGAHRDQEVSGIASGTYFLRFVLGRDWDSKTRTFLQSRSFYQAGRQLEFTETEPTNDSSGQYTELRLTLDVGPGGNLPRDRITEAAFDEGDLGPPGLSAEPTGAH